uniref:WGS project CAEQ00000000 data, annotated contig 1494 n=1 Tax=Trypanosoma congolense (strain IL3000) TaxID=1068625 RepID=F9W6P1_TRYCI|nr:unnamed protein product [Trypanosoma congolense IL3000]
MFADREDLISEAVAAFERQRELSGQLYGSMSDGDDDEGLLNTYLRVRAEKSLKLPAPGDDSGSMQSTVEECDDCSSSYGNHGITETISEMCSLNGERRSRLHHEYSTIRESTPLRPRGHSSRIEVVHSPVKKANETSVTKSSLHRSEAVMNDTRWSDSLHTDLERLNIELEHLGRPDPSLLHEYQRVRDMSKNVVSVGRYSQHEQDKQRHDSYHYSREPTRQQQRRSVSRITSLPGSRGPSRESSFSHDMMPRTEAATRWGEHLSRREPTIELSEVCDSSDDYGKCTSTLYKSNTSSERKQRVKEDWLAKELKECTFNPQLSPASVSIFHKKSQSKDSVFHRLYQQARTDRNAEGNSLNNTRGILLSERDKLREACGVTTSERAGSDSFELFLSNVLGPEKTRSTVFVDTKFESPLARKASGGTACEASDVTRSVCRNPSARNRGDRSKSFQDFLLRQNMHQRNRVHVVREIIDSQRPTFKPEITEASVQIAKKLLARGECSGDNISGASPLAAAVKKHRSPYVDPCTFKPKTSPGSSGVKSLGAEVLYLDSVRRSNAIKAAQAKAQSQEADHPFRPSLNDVRNARVESYLSSKNLSAYSENLKKRREQLMRIREEKRMEEERKEAEESTFRPKLSRMPSYVARMTSSFAIVRQQYNNA